MKGRSGMRLLGILLLSLPLLWGCSEGNDLNNIRKPYGDSFKMADIGSQLQVETYLSNLHIQFRKEPDGYIQYSLYDHHHVLSAIRASQGASIDPFALESIPPASDKQKSLITSELERKNLWHDVGYGPNGNEIITWRSIDGSEVDLIRRNVRLILLGINPSE